MGNKVLSQHKAWETYDEWLENGRAVYLEEPPSIDPVLRFLSQSRQAAPKDWADSYVAAFAQVSGLRLITLDQALHRRSMDRSCSSPNELDSRSKQQIPFTHHLQLNPPLHG